MRGKFTHYLITRFNVPVKNWDRDKSGHPTLDNAWMEERMHLFNTYCVPTIRKQTVQDFHWILYCDTQTDHSYLDSIGQAIRTLPNAEVRLADDFDALVRDLRQLLAHAGAPFVITSRVDNDDGLGLDYIRLVQSHFEPKDKVLINLTGGILYDTRRKVLTNLHRVMLNHYGSLIEERLPDQLPLTVLGFPHHQPPEGITITNVQCHAAWLKIIHDRNLKSKINGVPVFNRKVIARFGLGLKDIPISLLQVISYSLGKGFSILKRTLMPSVR